MDDIFERKKKTKCIMGCGREVGPEQSYCSSCHFPIDEEEY